LELSNGAEDRKTRMMRLPGRQRSLTISSAVWTECTNVTDGQTPGDSKDCAYTHSVARLQNAYLRLYCNLASVFSCGMTLVWI